MKGFTAVFLKDLQIEFRTGEAIVPLVTLSLLLTSFLGLGITSFVKDEKTLQFLFHPVIWSLFLLTGAFTTSRLLESDKRAELLAAFTLYRIPLVGYYLSKVIFLSLLVFFNHLISSFFFSLFFEVSLVSVLSSFLGFSALVTLGYSALAILVSGMLLQHTNRSLLLPLVFLPLLFPLFFAVVEVSSSIAINAGILGAGTWLTLIVGLATAYLLAGVLLFDIVVKE